MRAIVARKERGRDAAAAVVAAAPGHTRRPPRRAAAVSPHTRRVVACALPDDDPLAALGLAPPPLDGDLDALQAEAGAEVVSAPSSSSSSSPAIVSSFGEDAAAAAALRSEEGVALVDAGGWTVLRLAGPGAVRLLHAQSSADFLKDGGAAAAPPPGSALKTVFTTPAGGALAIGTALIQEGGSVLLLLGPAGPIAGAVSADAATAGPAAVAKRLAAAAALPADPSSAVSVDDVSPRCAVFGLLGRGSGAALARLGARSAAESLRPGGFTILAGGPGRAPVFVVGGSGLAAVAGFTLLADRDSGGAAALWAALTGPGCGAVPAGAALWHAARVEDGCPAPGAELDGKHNPFEAGLGASWVSVAKGCYLGAEALTKVAGVKGRLKAELWGLRIAAPAGVAPAAGDAVVVVVVENGGGGEGGSGGPPLGRLTSVAPSLPGAAGAGGTLALAYLSPGRTGGAELKAGLRVRVLCGGGGGVPAEAVVEALPHAERARPVPGKVGEAAATTPAAPPPAAAPADKAAAAAAREAKLAAMKARLDAWQAQQAAQQGGEG